jgi:hypothetical protein
MNIKLCVVTVIGPNQKQPELPNDLDFHLLARGLLEKNNPGLDVTWLVSFKKTWGIEYPKLKNTVVHELSESDLPELSFGHSSLEHGAMLNYMLKQVPESSEFTMVADPDCFLVGYDRLHAQLREMKESGTTVAGTTYGMGVPKSYFRDFPTVFSMIFRSDIVRLSDLDFTVDLNSLGNDEPPGTGRSSGLLGALKVSAVDKFRFLIGKILKRTLSLENPIRWGSFVMEFRNGYPEVILANETSFKVRASLKDSVKHEEFRLVIPDHNADLDSSRNKIVVERPNSQDIFGVRHYFRNHGVFEGWKLKNGNVGDWATYFLVRFFAKRYPKDSGRFPTSSMVFASNTIDMNLINKLQQKQPTLDVWCKGGKIFAVHLGQPTKENLKNTSGWYSLKDLIESI